jgi:hypothetical protein
MIKVQWVVVFEWMWRVHGGAAGTAGYTEAGTKLCDFLT